MAIKCLTDGRWICYYRHTDFDGVSRLKKEYFGRGAKAEAAAKKRNAALKFKKRRPVAKHHGPTVADLAKIYLINKNFSPNSAKHLKIRLTANILPSFGHKAAIDLVDQDIDNYIHKRRADPIYNRAGKIIRYGVKNSTIAREITDLQAILNWSKKRRPPLIAFNPVGNYKKPKADDAVIAPITSDELARLMAVASAHVLRAIKISYYIGLRPGYVELLSLRWSMVDFQRGYLLVTSANKGGPKQRLVYIHPDFIAEFQSWYDADKKSGPIIHYHGKAIKKFGKAWVGTLKRAGITRRIRPYDLRHLHMTRALEEGADIKALSQNAGSAPQTIVKHYQHVSRELNRVAVTLLPGLPN